MQDSRAQRWLGVGGLIFVVLVKVAGVTTTNLGPHSTAAEVVDSVHQHKGVLFVSALVTGLAVLEGLFFLLYLREYLCDEAANRRLAGVAFAGAIVFAVSGALGAGIKLSMADTVNNVNPVVLQTLNVLQNDLNVFIAGTGVAAFLLANGLAIVRNGPLPTWVGWIAIVLAVFGLVLGAPAAGLWILVASIVILVRAGRSVPSLAGPGSHEPGRLRRGSSGIGPIPIR